MSDMGLRAGVPTLFAGLMLAVCGCGGSAMRTSNAAAVADTHPAALRAYLRAWEASWRRRAADISRIVGDDDSLDFSTTPDSTWPRWQRIYEETAVAFRKNDRRLAAIATPPALRSAHDAYRSAVRREAERFQDLADALAGTDPETVNGAEVALSNSQMLFDYDGAKWETAVIAACRASGITVPRFVRRTYISNGQRTG
jgi:hypothetical protein